jgi:hypothetical protein
MAIWPWIGWLVDGKIYGEAAEFLQVKDPKSAKKKCHHCPKKHSKVL